MALLDFPPGPSLGQSTTQNGNTWKWNGTSWVAFNNVSLTSQVTGILAVDYGGTGFGGTYTAGDILYALSSNTFGKLNAGTAGSVLASGGPSTAPYWKKDDAGTGSVSAGTLGGFAYYDTTNSITSGTAVSYIIGSGAGGTGATFVIKQSTMALIGSTITAGTWAGSAITAKYGGTGLDALSTGDIIYGSATDTYSRLTHPGAGYALTSVGSTVAWVTISSLSTGSATNTTNVAVNSTTGTGSSYLVFVSAQTGNLPILTNANVTVDASTSTITATLAGTATTANRVGITTSVGAGTSFLYFGSAASGSAALGATTTITVTASTGTITATNFSGLASTATLANNVGITTSVGAGTSFLYFGSAASGSAALGATTTITVTASTGTITATNFSGLASTATLANNVGITTHVGAGTSFLYFGSTASGNGALGSTTLITVAANTGTITATLAGTATTATRVGITTSVGAGSSFIYFGNAASGSVALGATTLITAEASTGTITAINFSGTATTANRVGITTSVGAGTSFLYFGSAASGSAALGATTTITVTASTGTITATNFSGTATKATNVVGGASGAGSSILIQTGLDTTGFLSHPGSAGQALTTNSTTGLAWTSLTNLAVTSVSAGTAIQVSANTGAVTITNNGVHSVSGTTNRVNVSGGLGGTGAVTLTLPNTVVVNDIQVDGNNSTLGTVGPNPTSIVNKQYVDNLASGLDIHDSVRLVITSAIGASYYQPGYGIGNTATGAYLTSIGNSTFPAFDGVTIGSTGLLQRVLVTGGLTATGKTSINGSALVSPATLADSYLVNGIYYLGSVGSGSSQWYLYRAAETDDNTELTGGTFTFVEEGDLFKDTGWVCTNDTTNLGPIQFGSTAISFSQFTGAAAISFGQGLTRVGNTVASKINLSATGAASAIGFTQFNIGGPNVGGAADTGYYPTFSVRTGTIHAGASLLTLNHTGFSLVGSTNTAATLTVTGNISLPNPGAGGSVAYSSDANTLAFVGGTSEQILKSNGTSAPSFVNQNTIIAGGAGTAANIQGGAGGSIPYQSGANTTVFLNNPGAGYALTTVSATSIAYQTISSLSVGSATNSTTATNANNVAVNSTTGTGSSYLVFVSAQTGNLPILTNANVTVDASTSTITATLAGTATTANRVGITTSVGAGTSFLYFGSAASGSAALGATTTITVTASTGTITATNFTGLASTATLANTVGITTSVGAGTSFLYFGSSASGSAALGATTTITVTASTGTITATNFSGLASTATLANNVGITTHVGAGTSFLYFGSTASGSGALGSTTLITVAANTGTITATLAGTATTATRVGITTSVGAGSSFIYFGNAASGSVALGATTLITAEASTGTITAINFSGTATTANRVGITTSVGAGTSFLYFGSAASGSVALGATTTITVTASTGTITATNFSGLASTATLANNVGITTHVGAGTSFLYFGSTASGSGALGSTTLITVAAITGTITATNFSGIASSATRVGITTSVSTSDLPIVFADAHQPYAALGSSTLLTYQASTGKITNGIWAGTAITTGRGGTGLITVSRNEILMGASTGNTWAAVGSSVVPVVSIGAAAPAKPGGAIGDTQAGQLWWDSEYGVLKVYYVDATPTAQWVDATPVLGSSGGGSSTKRSYVMTFGAGFTPSTGADTVQIHVPYAPDNASKYYFIKRLDYRNETDSSGAGVSFFIERFTGGNAAFTSPSRIHTAGSGAGSSFKAAGAGIFITSYTLSSTGASFVSSSGVAGSVISGDYLRLNFSNIGGAATMSVSIILEEQ